MQTLREKAGISRYGLAKAAKIDYAVLTRIEEGERSGIQFQTVCRIARALDVSLDDLATAAGMGRKKARSTAAESTSAILLVTAGKVRTKLAAAVRDLDGMLERKRKR